MKILSGSAVPRHMVFVLDDGEPVVQWTEQHVQELLSGKYRPYDVGMFGHPITDYELEQLKTGGRVEHFNRQYVWLYALPENSRFALRTQDGTRGRRRAFYINTTLPPTHMDEVRGAVSAGALNDAFSTREQDDLITIWRQNGTAFTELPDAEDALRWLVKAAPDVFKDAAVAFIETAELPIADAESPFDAEATLSLDDVISAMDTAETRAVSVGRQAVVMLSADGERAEVLPILTELSIEPLIVTSSTAALHGLEDHHPDLLIMEVAPPDMHAWQMLSKAREAGLLKISSVIVIGESADDPSATLGIDPAFALAVAGVDEYLPRPITPARIRASILAVLKRRR